MVGCACMLQGEIFPTAEGFALMSSDWWKSDGVVQPRSGSLGLSAGAHGAQVYISGTNLALCKLSGTV